MPATLGGFEPDIVVVRGEEHVAALDPARDADVETRARLEGLLEATGGDFEDLTSGYALVSVDDFSAFVVAIRIVGAEPGTLLPAYLPILYRDLIDSSGSPGTIGGKDVLVVSSLGEGEEMVELYVYAAGDTVWLLQGPEDVVAATLGGLP